MDVINWSICDNPKFQLNKIHTNYVLDLTVIVGNNQQKLNEIRQRGKEFIASTGPPLVFGERRVGWMREYFTPESKRADVIYAYG